MVRHLFLSESGDLLPRWEQAFPKATATKIDATGDDAKPPDLVWLRLRDGLSVAAQMASMRERFGQVACIALSDIPGDDEALAAFAASARGYCNSHAQPALLKQAATVVGQGGLWIGEGLMQRLVAVVGGLPRAINADDKAWAADLTERERQVAETIVAGASNKEIARQLGITERTVKAHVGAILEKLQVRDRLQLALLISGQQKAD
jgi:two-component system nitrate/nitrite response regulator NarL